MKEKIKKMESTFFVVIVTFNITKHPNKYLQILVGQGGGILELTQGELEHAPQD